jgi:hypothetical protein
MRLRWQTMKFELRIRQNTDVNTEHTYATASHLCVNLAFTFGFSKRFANKNYFTAFTVQWRSTHGQICTVTLVRKAFSVNNFRKKLRRMVGFGRVCGAVAVWKREWHSWGKLKLRNVQMKHLFCSPVAVWNMCVCQNGAEKKVIPRTRCPLWESSLTR